MNKPLNKRTIVPLSGIRLKGRSWKTTLPNTTLAAILRASTKLALELNTVEMSVPARKVDDSSLSKTYVLLARKFSELLGEAVAADDLSNLSVCNNVYLGQLRIEVLRRTGGRLQNLALILRGQLYAAPRG